MPIMSLPSVVLGAGWLLVVAAVIMSICKIHLPGIRNLYLQAAGNFLIFLIFGQEKLFGLSFGSILSGGIIGALIDPFIWKKLKFYLPSENLKKASWLINIMLMISGSLAFLIGYAFLR